VANTIYTAEAHVAGGREGHGRTSDGALEVDLRMPTEVGGPGGGTNPEQLFAIGYAACFEGALGVVGRRAKTEIGDAEIDARVSLSADGSGGLRLFKLSAIELDVTLPGVSDPETAKELVKAAHVVCAYSNVTRGNIEVALTANGQPVD
jgi:osmotically inducible protein OsmC